jgi:ribosomal-protein-alanine N-acetyltransferase
VLNILNYIALERFTTDDITDEYTSWLKDTDVNEYLEVRFEDNAYEDLLLWYSRFDFKNSYLWKVVDQRNGLTIGTASLYAINRNHSFAHYGYLIGNKEYWGGSTAFTVVAKVFNFAFYELRLENIRAGAYANNIGAITNFLKLGMKPQGVRPKSLLHKTGYVDEVLYGYSRIDWEESEISEFFSKGNFPNTLH